MNRMPMTVAEKTKLGGVTSFDKWPGYEQQFGSKKTQTSQKYGIKKCNCFQEDTNISGKNCMTSIHWRRKENLEKQIASSNLKRRKEWEKCGQVYSEY